MTSDALGLTQLFGGYYGLYLLYVYFIIIVDLIWNWYQNVQINIRHYATITTFRLVCFFQYRGETQSHRGEIGKRKNIFQDRRPYCVIKLIIRRGFIYRSHIVQKLIAMSVQLDNPLLSKVGTLFSLEKETHKKK